MNSINQALALSPEIERIARINAEIAQSPCIARWANLTRQLAPVVDFTNRHHRILAPIAQPKAL